MDELRTEISKITEGGAKTFPEQVEKINALKGKFSHSIKHLKYPDKKNRYNCFMHACGVIGSQVVIDHLRRDAQFDYRYGIKVGSSFVLRLIEKNILNIRKDGEVIIYFMDNEPKHGGRVEADRVTSKWGTDCLWEHGVWEVLSEYGNRTERFSIPNREQVEREFDAYAQDRIERYNQLHL